MRELKPFDASSYLTSDEIIDEFLAICREDPNPKVYLSGLKEVGKALAARALAEPPTGSRNEDAAQ